MASVPRSVWGLLVVVVGMGAAAGVWFLRADAPGGLSFDHTVGPLERDHLTRLVGSQPSEATVVSVDTSLTAAAATFEAYVPVTAFRSGRQAFDPGEPNTAVFIDSGVDDLVIGDLARALGVPAGSVQRFAGSLSSLTADQVAFIPVQRLTPEVKLLSLGGHYYLDSFSSGAVFRNAVADRGQLPDLSRELPDRSSVLSLRMTGVTALTRKFISRSATVDTPGDFAGSIGSFLADADVTHVSNEVSFLPGCQLSRVSFCAPPSMIEVLEASGVDVVELTGNHNNDHGREANAATIEQYHELGWGTFGGGINAAEAARAYLLDQKSTTVALLGYNVHDAPSGAPIATVGGAGANPFDRVRAGRDIAAAHRDADVVIVDVQFDECYSYPQGGVEFPPCDVPVPQQEDVFRSLVDLGADVVIGTQAHQPQTFEIYQGKPIFYGLGNLFFDQIEWPDTTKGIILTHYLIDGRHVQTRLSPTRYGADLKPHLMDDSDAEEFLARLASAPA